MLHLLRFKHTALLCLCLLGAVMLKGQTRFTLDIDETPGANRSQTANCSIDVMEFNANALSTINSITETIYSVKYTLFKNNVEVDDSGELIASSGPTNSYPFAYPTSSGEYYVKLLVKGKDSTSEFTIGNYTSEKLTITAGSPSVNFDLNGQNSFIKICETNFINMNASTNCEDRWRVGIDKGRTGQFAYSNWRVGRPADYRRINISDLLDSLNITLEAGPLNMVRLEVGNGSETVFRDKNLRILSNIEQASLSNLVGVCIQQNTTYQVDSIPGATYTWHIPNNVSLVSSPNGFTRVVSGTQLGTDTIQVTIDRICNGPIIRQRALTVSSTAPSQPSIGGFATACAGAIESYSATATEAIQYSWSSTGGVVIQGSGLGQGINAQIFDNGTLTVVASNGCGVSQSRTLNITATSCGGTDPCEGARQAYEAQPFDLQLSPVPVSRAQGVLQLHFANVLAPGGSGIAAGSHAKIGNPCVRELAPAPALQAQEINSIAISNLMGQRQAYWQGAGLQGVLAQGQGFAVPVQHLAAGVYVVSVATARGQYQRRFVVAN